MIDSGSLPPLQSESAAQGDLCAGVFACSDVAEPPSVITSRQIPGVLPPMLNGRYRLDGLLGAGGMGVVYRARDVLRERFGDPDPYVALKFLREDLRECPDGGALLYSEYALTRYMLHPGVVRVHSFEIDDSCQQSFFTMELIRGMPLDRLLCEQPCGLPWEESRATVAGMLEALAYAHGRGVLHGDIKPSNVILCEDGPRLFDFGLGSAECGVLDGLAQLSRSRLNAWTPGYSAPELMQGGSLSRSADVFAAGCVVYELLGGELPYGRMDAKNILDQTQDFHLKCPRNLPPNVWPALRQALQLDPALRTISCSQLHRAFAQPSGVVQRRWFKPKRRHTVDEPDAE